LSAVHCAIDIQKDLAKLNEARPNGQRMQFRIGINVGDVMVKDGDIFGDGVNIAARLEGLADAGGICISRGIHDQVMKKLPYDFEDLGEQKVKNIAQPVRAFKLMLDGRRQEMLAAGSEDPPSTASDLPSLSESSDAVAANPQAVEIEFWDSIKTSTLASEYEAYLQRYPEGSFADLARIRLKAIAEDAAAMRVPKDQEIELAFWDSVRASTNAALIKAYLDKYPHGEFSTLARIRLDELGGAANGAA
jgi:adenylate cyclase